jgi:hypothetical protein
VDALFNWLYHRCPSANGIGGIRPSFLGFHRLMNAFRDHADRGVEQHQGIEGMDTSVSLARDHMEYKGVAYPQYKPRE